jgi:hypothetical protein
LPPRATTGDFRAMKYTALAAALLLSACATAEAQTSRCPPAGYDRAQLEAIKTAEWAMPDDAARNALARALTACVGSPDPALRDGIAFEGLARWLRARALTNETMIALADDLQARLAAPDGPGFERPFAALVLSEVARADRIEAYLSAERRGELLDASVNYLASVRDYRGFDETEGWRHGVAHGADLMLQLSLNPAFGKPEVERIRDALATQVGTTEHFYIYGEPERIARPIIFMAQRGLISEAEWTQWFAQFTVTGDNPYMSQAGLARIHNIKAFLNAVLVGARMTQSTADDVLIPGADAAFRALP